ncbi:TraB/TrbI/VirB10 family type IV secretion system protein [Vibrio parahaemolyticus]|uniref:hypothetical protein n=1 Tax=Vibrio parahaemolyticus TaxID=670 RepID=UPI00387B56E9
MEPLSNSADEPKVDENLDSDASQGVGGQNIKDFGKKISKRSAINKVFFTGLGVTIVLVGGYLYIDTKMTEYERNSGSSATKEESVPITSVRTTRGTEQYVLHNEDHIEATKAAIKAERQAAIDSGGIDKSSSIADIQANTSSYRTDLDSEIAQGSGGTSFRLNSDFDNFIKSESRNYEFVDESEPDNSKGSKSRPEHKKEPESESKNKTATETPRNKRKSVHRGIQNLADIRKKAVAEIVKGTKEPLEVLTIKNNSETRSPVNTASRSAEESTNSSTTSTSGQKSLFNTSGFNTQGAKNGQRSKYDNNVNPLLTSNPLSNQQMANAQSESNAHASEVSNYRSPEPLGSTNPASKGLMIGDKMLGEATHGLHSSSESMYLIVELIQGPLKGAKVVYKPTLSYDTFVYQSSEIQFNGNRAAFPSIIITPDENQTVGYRSGVDYHTLYNLGMVFVYGMTKGAAEFVNNVADEVVVDGSTVTTSTQFSTEKLLWSAFGGVADAADPIVEKQLNKPPTVWVNSGDVVGIMMVGEWNPEWSPIITVRTNGIY